MSLRSPVAKARGLGSAKDGTHHWIVQRISAVALIPLCLWFVASLVCLGGASHAEVVAWMSQPVSAVLLVLLVATTFYHSQLGLQVVIEDYVHGASKIILLLTTKFLNVFLAALGIFAVLRVALGS